MTVNINDKIRVWIEQNQEVPTKLKVSPSLFYDLWSSDLLDSRIFENVYWDESNYCATVKGHYIQYTYKNIIIEIKGKQ